MKPSDRHACSHALFQKTWQIQSFLYLILLALASVPAVFSVIFANPSPVFWTLAIRAMHGGYAFCLILWWLRFSAAIPSIKRVLAAGVIRPPGDPGKPTNGSKRALDAWRDRVNEARSRLTPVLNRFTKIEFATRIALTIIISGEVLIAIFYELYVYLPVIEPLRHILTSPIYFFVLWILPPMPRRTGRSVYKTTTLIELMQPIKKKGGNINPQDGQQITSTSRYVVPVLLTDDMNDTDTKEAAMLRLGQIFRALKEMCPGFDERDVCTLLHRFDSIAGVCSILSADGFLKASNTSYEDNALLMRWYNSLPQTHAVVGGGNTGKNLQRVHGIDFLTHAKAIFDMCTASRPRLAMLVFEMYDTDRGGDLDRDEIRVLLMEVNSNSEEIAISEQDIDRFDADRGGTVDTEEFIEAVKSFPALLRPAYTLQRKFRDSTLSLRRWEQIADSAKKKYFQQQQHTLSEEVEEELEDDLQIITLES